MTQAEIRAFLQDYVHPEVKELLGRFDFEEVSRCWCGAELVPWVEQFAPYGVCSVCGCKTVRYAPTESSLQYLYSDSGYYWTGYQAAHGCPPVEKRFESDVHDRIPQYLSWIRSLASPPASTLEVGCGPGRLLCETSKAGYEAYACEMDAHVAAFAAEKSGRTVFPGGLPPLSEKPFDLIIVIDVFEHVRDPLLFARELLRRLAPRGKMLMHLPVIDSEDEARRHSEMFDPLSHLWLHTRASFQSLWKDHRYRATPIGELFGMPSWGLRRRRFFEIL